MRNSQGRLIFWKMEGRARGFYNSGARGSFDPTSVAQSSPKKTLFDHLERPNLSSVSTTRKGKRNTSRPSGELMGKKENLAVLRSVDPPPNHVVYNIVKFEKNEDGELGRWGQEEMVEGRWSEDMPSEVLLHIMHYCSFKGTHQFCLIQFRIGFCCIFTQSKSGSTVDSIIYSFSQISVGVSWCAGNGTRWPWTANCGATSWPAIFLSFPFSPLLHGFLLFLLLRKIVVQQRRR